MGVLLRVAGAAAAFAALDFLWLGLVMTGFYRQELGPLAYVDATGALAPIWAAAVPVYALLGLGVVAFVLPRAAGQGPLVAAGWGALYGALTYGVYDLTNLSTLRGYTATLAMVDIAWGACATGVVSALGALWRR